MVQIANFVVATNDRLALQRDLFTSPDLAHIRGDIFVREGFASASTAYNSGLDAATTSSAIAFVHQDVYLPMGWMGRVESQLDEVERHDPNWATAGVWGIGEDGEHIGRVWCAGGNKEHIGMGGAIRVVESIDEIVIILNTRHGLRWDEQLPGFHLYATDMITQARLRGLKSYVIDAPVVHNSRRNPQPLDKHYFAAYKYMQRKYRDHLPIRTAVVPITRWGVPLYRAWARREWRRLTGRVKAAPPRDDPRAIAIQLGYEPQV